MLCLLAGVSRAQVPERSAAACSSCHPSQAQDQPHTPMGEALFLPSSNLTLRNHRKLAIQKGAYLYRVDTDGEQSVYSVTDGVATISIPVRWSVGQGMQTWVYERNGSYYESLVSYYPSIEGLETTIGDEALSPRTLEEAAGRKLTMRDTKDCFGCHSTNAVSKGQLTLDSLQEGVTCEHCHVGSSTHLFDALQGIFMTAPASLKRLPAEDVSNFCGQCHRSWESVVRNHTLGVVNVRFQPYRLANSRCFSGTDPRIACTACHDPHKNLVKDDAAYDRKCLACHVRNTEALVKASSPAPTERGAKPCPVANKDCVSCHMPKIKLSSGFVTFTDHQIRIVKPGDPYPN